jgi:hypothetical protein
MKEVKLTQLQSQILKPIIDNYTDAKANFEQAIVLITGEPFKNASIENGVLRYVSMAITLVASIWASVAMEVVHGIITLGFAVLTCVVVFFVNRWLKKKWN